MLGKLFGCLAIMKSSKLSEATHIQFIVDTFMKLHHWKGWIREIITESILHLISIIPIKFTREIVFPAITPFLQVLFELFIGIPAQFNTRHSVIDTRIGVSGVAGKYAAYC